MATIVIIDVDTLPIVGVIACAARDIDSNLTIIDASASLVNNSVIKNLELLGHSECHDNRTSLGLVSHRDCISTALESCSSCRIRSVGRLTIRTTPMNGVATIRISSRIVKRRVLTYRTYFSRSLLTVAIGIASEDDIESLWLINSVVLDILTTISVSHGQHVYAGGEVADGVGSRRESLAR